MQYDNIISLHKNNKQLGVINNFSSLIKNSNADYIMFSDHDDVWFNYKIEITYNTMIELEKKYSKSTPLLVFTDKTVTDSNLRIINLSHNKSEHLNTKNISLNRLLMGNVVSGCTIMINKALKKIYYNIDNAIMYDYLLALIAVTFGHISYIDKPTMYYRQHEQNYLGAKSYSIKSNIQKLNKKQYMQNQVLKNILQAESFYTHFENMLDDKNKRIITEFISLKNKKNISFISTVIKNGFYKSRFMRNLGLFYSFCNL